MLPSQSEALPTYKPIHDLDWNFFLLLSSGKEANQSHYRPGVAQRVPASYGSQIT